MSPELYRSLVGAGIGGGAGALGGYLTSGDKDKPQSTGLGLLAGAGIGGALGGLTSPEGLADAWLKAKQNAPAPPVTVNPEAHGPMAAIADAAGAARRYAGQAVEAVQDSAPGRAVSNLRDMSGSALERLPGAAEAKWDQLTAMPGEAASNFKSKLNDLFGSEGPSAAVGGAVAGGTLPLSARLGSLLAKQVPTRPYYGASKGLATLTKRVFATNPGQPTSPPSQAEIFRAAAQQRAALKALQGAARFGPLAAPAALGLGASLATNRYLSK